MRYSNNLHLRHLCLWEAPLGLTPKLSNSTTGKNKQSGYARPFVVAKQPLCFSLLLFMKMTSLYTAQDIHTQKLFTTLLSAFEIALCFRNSYPIML